MLPEWYQTVLYIHYWGALAGANILGLSLSAVLYVIGGKELFARCLTVDQLESGKPSKQVKLDESDSISALARFYLGSQWNPRFIGIDGKMLLYIVGAVGLVCNILAATFAHISLRGDRASNAIIIYDLMFFWFVAEYMYYEHVHIYTYDLFAEKLGFKLTWGCLVFYPFFYAIGIFSLVEHDVDLSLTQCIIILLVFIFGWVITRGANMQKYHYRISPNQSKFSFLFGSITVEQRTLPSSRILISGWWGVARHFNYFGEILQGLALSLPGVIVGKSTFYVLIPLLYPLYYVILFVTRQIDDDKVCSEKYGLKWTEYCKIVRWRICPKLW